MFIRIKYTKIIVGTLLLILILLFSCQYGIAADQENCMMCHQYPMLGIVDDEGSFKSYYVNEMHYTKSVHADVMCSECHKDITQIPHEKDTTVDCTTACHVIEPNTGRQFSHKNTYDLVQGSVHGKNSFYANNSSTNVKVDFPSCKSCHANEMLSYKEYSVNNISINAAKEQALHTLMLENSKGRCDECHSSPINYEFSEQKLNHVVRRIGATKSQMEIVDVCSSCHNDPEFNKRHELVNAVFSYRENYHGKIMILGHDKAPSCLDCHITSGDSLHQIYSVRDTRSATNIANRGVMCSTADCHPKASLGMGKAYIHTELERGRFPIQWWVMFFFTLLTIVSFVGLMIIMLMELFRLLFPNITIFKIFNKFRGGHDE